MKILVFDDSPIHRKSAALTLQGHDLTIVGNYDSAQAALLDETNQPFDVVLTDLLVPASRQKMYQDSELIGKEMPLGTIIALLAITRGVKNVAVVTDKNHHDHPASAAFDCFRKSKADGINIICTNDSRMIMAIDTATGEVVPDKFLWSEEGEKKYPSKLNPRCEIRDGIEFSKDWRSVLDRLIGSGS